MLIDILLIDDAAQTLTRRRYGPMMAAYKFLGSLLLLNTIKADPCAPPQIRLRNNTLNKTIAVVLRG